MPNLIQTKDWKRFFCFLSNPIFLYLIILALGVFARVWEIQSLPPGLNQDEASIGLEAYSLYHFGVDRMGISFPVNFISWGSGMDALYGYLLFPFMSLGLTPLIVRLPSLITGILSLPLIYDVAKKSFGQPMALISMFLLAISPWHIIMSRWGLNENVLPFIFLLGYAILIRAQANNGWFIVSTIFFALCLYAYAASYAAIPIFLFLATVTLLKAGRLSTKTLLIGFSVLVTLALPLILFVYINLAGMESITFGALTIPSLPVAPRMFRMIASRGGNPLSMLANNLATMINLLVIERWDGLWWNSMAAYGYLYSFSLPFIIMGIALFLKKEDGKYKTENLLLISWLAASLVIGLAQSVNFNRIHLVFIPLIFCAAASLHWIWNRQKFAAAAVLGAFLVSFAAFTYDYHNPDYAKNLEREFYAGFLPALARAEESAGGTICVSEKINMAYIYPMFLHPQPPAAYLKDIVYANPDEEFRQVRSYGKYVFGVEHCPRQADTVYVLLKELPPNPSGYTTESFYEFRVYLPNK